MSLLKVILLAIIQGLAELLPVSSSAHVVVAEKLMGLDPSSPAMTLLLVMLHTGHHVCSHRLFLEAVGARTFFSAAQDFKRFAWLAIIATVLTGIMGEICDQDHRAHHFQGRSPRADRGSVRPAGHHRARAAGGRVADSDRRFARAESLRFGDSLGVWAGDHHSARRPLSEPYRALPSLPRIFALRRDHFNRHARGCTENSAWNPSASRWP